MAYRKKKGTSPILVMILLILLSLLIVVVLYGIKTGIISFPDDEPVSTSSVISEETESSKPPPEPPKLSFTDVSGAGIKEKTAKLEELLAQKAFNVSVYYFDLSNGNTIEFNSLKKFSTGSVIKAPYCKWLISSGADLSQSFELTSADILEGSGSLKNEPIGTQKTVAELISLSVIYSDNTAYKMLTNHFGFDGYISYCKGLGVGANISKDNVFGTMSAAGAGVLFGDIYKYSLENPEESQYLLDQMKDTSYKKMISDVLDYPVAHKYGYNGGNLGFHDAAIVYADNPYILTIFTNLNPDTAGTVEYIQSLTKEINSIHSAIH